ncbi:cyanophycin synthetase [Actinoplanes sp. SE50/110]|nr:cyanophycin synthetase [Actinoplanes sp. SE50/110]
MVARLRLEELTGRETSDVTGFTERLLRALPGLAEHHCAAGAPGGFVSRLRGGTYFGHVTEHVCLELSQLIGRDVSFGRTVSAGEPGLYDVILECPVDESPESRVPGELLEAAVDLVLAVQAGQAGQPPRLAELAALAEREATGPSTRAIIAAARRRGIPVERFDDLSLVRLGWGTRRRMAWAAMTDRTSGVGIDIAGDKHVTRCLLGEAGIPVAAGGAATTVEEAVRLLDELGAPVVVKPRQGRQGRHVVLGLGTREAVERAFGEAGGDVVVERQLAGRDYRVLMVAGEVAAAAERIAAHVVGDGTTTLAGLVERTNADPRRGPGHSRVLTRIALDEVALRVAGIGPDDVPAEGETVWLRECANLSTGGTSRDVTDQVHPDVTRLCQRVVALVGLDIAGIDLRLPDIGAPLPPAGETEPAGGVIEVNAVPGLRMHLAPVRGRSRDVGDAIVRAMFPGGSDGRIPTVAVTGTNGKTTVTRLTAHLLGGGGHRVGAATTDGVFVDGRAVYLADATGPRSAQQVLGDPQVDIAVLETARGGLLRRGLGYDWSDVGVITNITADHLGQDGLDSIEDLAHVKAVVAERVRDGGTLVLNADDPWVRSLASRPRVRADRKRLVWFGLDPGNPVLTEHLGRGGTAYLLQDGWLVQATGARRTPLLRVAEVPRGVRRRRPARRGQRARRDRGGPGPGCPPGDRGGPAQRVRPGRRQPGPGHPAAARRRLGLPGLRAQPGRARRHPAYPAPALGGEPVRGRGDAAGRPARRPAGRVRPDSGGRADPGRALRRPGPAGTRAGGGAGAGRAGDAGPPAEPAGGPRERVPGGGDHRAGSGRDGRRGAGDLREVGADAGLPDRAGRRPGRCPADDAGHRRGASHPTTGVKQCDRSWTFLISLRSDSLTDRVCLHDGVTRYLKQQVPTKRAIPRSARGAA